jgi:poly-gamma-glutamate synthesis protein (capsule biosynthesis protein)
MGFDLFSVANNHAADYGVAGVQAALAHLRAADLGFAGLGGNLAEARAPAYADTAAGRVALVAATSFLRPGDQAADQRSDSLGRPGVNPLRYATTYTVDDAALAALRDIGAKLGFAQERARHRQQFYAPSEAPEDSADAVAFLTGRFRRGAAFGISTRVNARDAEENLRWIREARRQADWVVFSFHNHEFGPAGRLTAAKEAELEEPAGFMVDFAHAAIDAGADVVAGHGPHLTLGIEIYNGKPIFYSLGNFIFQNDTIRTVPAEAYARFDLGPEATPADFLDARTGNGSRGFPATPEFWQSFVGECAFEAGRLAAVRLHPIDLGHGRSRAARGRPMLARGAVAKAVLDRLERLSARFGTVIERAADGTGRIVLP